MQTILVRSLIQVSENKPKIISIGRRITEKLPFKELKMLSFLAFFISKTKTADIFNYLSVKCFIKSLLFLKIWNIWVDYCWSYGSSNLLFRFFHYRLGHLNKRQTKIAQNSTIYFFSKLAPKQVFLESFKFFDAPTTKWRSLKFFTKLNGNHILMANFSKLREYQSFVLIELHNLS